MQHENGSLDQQHPCKCWVSTVAWLRSQAAEVQTRGPWGRLVIQTSTVGGLWVRWEDPACFNEQGGEP